MIVPLLMASGILGSCRVEDHDLVEHVGSGQQITSPDELNPSMLPGKHAMLVLRDVNVPVTLKRSERGGLVELSLDNEGGPIEVELYRSESKSFAYAGLRLGGPGSSGDFYEPAIPLLRFPMSVGDSWKWEGSNVSGEMAHPATAVVSTSAKDGSVRVEVALALASGGPQPARRSLIFWFAPGKGLYKREFGDTSTRIPAGD